MPATEPSAAPSTEITINGDVEAPHVACQICRDNVAEADTVALRGCGHRFCAECIAGFIDVRIQEGDVELKCFHQDSEIVCGVMIDYGDVEALVGADMVAKYRKFALLRFTPQARTCPFCEHTQVTTATADEPTCLCERCERTFCFTHGNAHAGDEACTRYEKRQSRAEKRSGRRVKKISRPCPECARPIERNGGCAHMTCRVCKAEFCWHCGTKWGFDASLHNNLLSLDSCDGTAEARAPWMDSSNVWCRRLARTLYYIFLLGIGWPLTLALCWAWIPYTIVKENRAISRRACVLARFIGIYAILGIIFCVGVIVILLVDCCEALFEAGKSGFRKLKQLIRGLCFRATTSSRTADKPDNGTNFSALLDAGVAA